jgi:hypothetical protein
MGQTTTGAIRMITPEIVRAVREALALLPPAMDTIEAHVEMYAIGLQESRFEHRRQLVGNPPRPTGPAKGFWQFERGGGCRGVVEHDASRYWMSSVCKARGVAFSATAIWNALEKDDVLAAAAARLLLFTDPKKLPEVGKADEAWNCYKRTWRPGKPHRQTWDALYANAVLVAKRERLVE